MKQRSTEEIARNARDGAAIDRAFVAAYRRTVLRHRAQGVPLAIWRNGAVVDISPDEVELPAVGDETPAAPGRR
jgi:hypothetical protein